MGLTGCAAWCGLIEEQAKNEKYDEFADMSKADVAKFNADPKNENKIICRDEKPTGTNIPQRVCYWESQLEERTRADQREIRRRQK